MDQFVIGFIGAGGMANAHRESLRILWQAGQKSFTVAAVCDIDAAKAERMADQFADFLPVRPSVYTDAAAMLAAERSLDSVLVITPHVSHHSLAIMAMEAGVNVMTEKPIAFTVRLAKEMMKTAGRTGKLLHVAENYRMAPDERAIHWAIKSGMIGVPRVLNWMDIGERKWYWDWRDHVEIAGGAWTLDGGVHHSDLFQYNLGPVKRVTAVSRTFDTVRYQKYESLDDYEQARLENRYVHFRKTRSLQMVDQKTLQEQITATVEDTTAAVLEFENSAVGTWLVSRAAPGKVDRSNGIYGSQGAIFWGEGVYNANQEQVHTMESLRQAFMDSLNACEREAYFPFGVQDTLAIEWQQHFAALAGLRPVEVTAEVGLMAMAVPLAIYESAEIGRPVDICDVLDLKAEAYQNRIVRLANLTP
jgi:predicted dehydrogenase